MANIHNRFPKRSTWADFSHRLCKFYRLPHGSKFVLVGPNHRCIRDDKVVTRALITPGVLSRSPRQNVRNILDAVDAMLATRPAHHGWRIEARGPSNQPIDLRTLLSTWQGMEPALTETERAARRMRQDEIDLFVRPQANTCIAGLEEGLDEPNTKVPQALLAELTEHYGIEAVRGAIAELRI